MTDPRILTAAEIDEIERLSSNFRNGFKGDTLAALIATVRHERERADEAERIVDDLVQLYAPQIGERCPWCELYPRSHGDWWEPYQHADDCAYIRAREHLAQRVGQPAEAR